MWFRPTARWCRAATTARTRVLARLPMSRVPRSPCVSGWTTTATWSRRLTRPAVRLLGAPSRSNLPRAMVSPIRLTSFHARQRCCASRGTTWGTWLTSTNPSGAASAWTVSPITPSAFGAGLSDLVCPSVSLCVGAGGANVFASSNPTGGAAAWTGFSAGAAAAPAGLHVACPSVSLCVAVDGSGDALTSNNPAGGAPAWSTAHVDGGTRISAVSCPSTALCVAVDVAGNAIVGSATPTAAQTRALLRPQLRPHGRKAKIAGPAAKPRLLILDHCTGGSSGALRGTRFANTLARPRESGGLKSWSRGAPGRSRPPAR